MSAGCFSSLVGLRAGALSLALLAPVAAPPARAADEAPELIRPPVVTQPQDEGASSERRRYHLSPTGDGGYTYEGPQFDARIAPDGHVSFEEPGPVQVTPGTTANEVGIDAVTPQLPISGDMPAPAIPARPGISFDVTDEIMHLRGDDPARPEKAAFLAATFEIRVKMAAHWNRVLNDAALAELPARLDQLWQDQRFTLVERRHVLMAMWDELSPGPEGDAARAIIRRFADEHLAADEAAQFR